MRKLIAAFKVSLDMKYQGPGDYADWVPAWAEDYDLGDRIDACLLGGAMYRGYERYWSGVRDNPDAPSAMTGTVPTEGEKQWSARIPSLTHHVLTRSLTSAAWSNTRMLSGIEEIADLKREKGQAIFLMGGGKLFRLLVAAGLVDELRLIIHPLAAGGPHSLFDDAAARQQFSLIAARPIDGGRLRADFRLG